MNRNLHEALGPTFTVQCGGSAGNEFSPVATRHKRIEKGGLMNMKALTLFCVAGVAIAIGFANTGVRQPPPETLESLKTKQAQIKEVIAESMLSLIHI